MLLTQDGRSRSSGQTKNTWWVWEMPSRGILLTVSQETRQEREEAEGWTERLGPRDSFELCVGKNSVWLSYQALTWSQQKQHFQTQGKVLVWIDSNNMESPEDLHSNCNSKSKKRMEVINTYIQVPCHPSGLLHGDWAWSWCGDGEAVLHVR